MLEMVIEVVIVDFGFGVVMVEVVVQDVGPNTGLGVVVYTVCIVGTLV
jgi:hypothetical protein